MLCSVLYMEGSDFKRVVTECEKGILLAKKIDFEGFKSEIDKLAGELEKTKIKAKAQLEDKSALDLREELE